MKSEYRLFIHWLQNALAPFREPDSQGVGVESDEQREGSS